MPKFSDALKREWDLEIRYPHLAKLQEIGCDLDALCAKNGEGFIDGFLSLPIPVKVAAFWELCKKQRPEVNEDSFAEGFDGDTLESACVTFMKAVAFFFRKPLMAQLLSRLQRIQEAETAAMAEVVERGVAALPAHFASLLAKPESTPTA